MADTLKWIEGLFEGVKDEAIMLCGKCHDCKEEVQITCMYIDGELQLAGGAVYKVDGMDRPFFKCIACLEKDKVLKNYQPTEIFSRVCGYLRPVNAYNPGKQAEFHMRTNYKF